MDESSSSDSDSDSSSDDEIDIQFEMERLIRTNRNSRRDDIVIQNVFRGRTVWNNDVVMYQVYQFLNLDNLLTCRLVCALWNDYILRLFELKSLLVVQPYSNKHRLWPSADASPSFNIGLHRLLTTMPQIQRERSILRHAMLSFNGHRFMSQRNDPNFLHGHVPLLRDFGWMIQRLDICIGDIPDLFNILRYCRNLKDLILKFDLITTESREGENGLIIMLHNARDDTDYSGQDQRGIVVMENLRMLDMEYNIQWRFGDFWRKRALNLTTLKCKDHSYQGSFVVPEGRVARDPGHFAKEVAKMTTKNLVTIEYIIDDDGLVTKSLVLLLPLLRCNLSSLRSFQLPIMNYRGRIHAKFHNFLMKVSESLTSLDLSTCFKKRKIPYMPNLIQACIPHCIIDSPDFFNKKMPDLKKLVICSKSIEFVSFRDPNNVLQIQSVRERKQGFYRGNAEMWRTGGGWLPHKKLRVLEIELNDLTATPKTLASLFPSLVNLMVTVYPEGLRQLKRTMRIMRNHNSLHHFKVVIPTDFFIYRPEGKLDVLIALVLMGIKNIWLDPHAHAVNVADLLNLATEFSLRRMHRLKKFTLENVEASVYPRVNQILETYCFPYMSALEEKEMVMNKGSPPENAFLSPPR